MRTIKIMFAASEEMHGEMTSFSELVNHLNEVLEPRGIELKRVKWNPETDGSIEDYKAKLSGCEMCLTLYWRDMAGNSEEELDTAYHDLKDGQNPRHLYVFFKEPADDLTEVLKDFKANFVTKYGHFFCKFENVDTMKLHFVLQFEMTQNQHSDLVEVKNGQVSVCGKQIVDLKNVPFAALNKEYQRLQRELLELDLKVAEAKMLYLADDDNEELEDKWDALKAERKKKKEEFEQYQKHIYDIALSFARIPSERYSALLVRAHELFEQGKVTEADELLDHSVIIREMESEEKLYDQHKNNIDQDFELLIIKTKTVMGNTNLTMPERFAVACQVYEKCIHTAQKLHYEQEKIAEILFDYAYLLQQFKKMYKAVDIYEEALEIYRQLAKDHPDAYLPGMAETLNNLANLQRNLHRYADAEQNYLEALEIYRQLAKDHPDAYLSDVAMTLNNLAILQDDLHRYADAEQNYLDALDIRRQLAKDHPDAYLSDVAMTLNNLAALQDDLHRYAEAEQNYLDALGIYRQLAKENPDAYLPDVATTLNNLAILQKALHRYAEAEQDYQEALEIRRQLAKENPDAYLPDVADTLNGLAILQKNLHRYDEAEQNYLDALGIYRQLAKDHPDAYLPDVAMTLYNLAILKANVEQMEEAVRLIGEALDIYVQLEEKNPGMYQEDIEQCKKILGL